MFVSQVTVDPQKFIDYVERNRNKKLFIDLLLLILIIIQLLEHLLIV
jgi:hypothetical protein